MRGDEAIFWHLSFCSGGWGGVATELDSVDGPVLLAVRTYVVLSRVCLEIAFSLSVKVGEDLAASMRCSVVWCASFFLNLVSLLVRVVPTHTIYKGIFCGIPRAFCDLGEF